MRKLVLILALLAVAPVARTETMPDPQDLVAKADRIRNSDQSFRVTSTLVEYVGGVASNRTGLVVYAKEDPRTNQYRNIVRYVEPSRDIGKMVLMNASKMWFYDPDSKASVPLSPEQRLVGQASAADVVVANLGHDYKAVLLGEETLLDGERTSRDCWHLDLTASTDDAMYGRVEYWLEKGTNRPVKGKFFSDSGRLLKIAYYRRYQPQLGETRPTELVIIDAVDSSQATIMTMTDWRFQDIPDAWYQRDFLPRLKAD